MNSQPTSSTSDSETPDLLLASNRLLCGPFLGGLSALTGGLVTWGIVQACFPVFTLPPELMGIQAQMPLEMSLQLNATMAEIAKHHVMLALAMFGLLVAFLLTSVEAFRRQVFRSFWWRGILAGLVAAGIGAGAGALGAIVFAALKTATDFQPLQKTIIMQAAMLGVVGMGIGIGVGVSFQRFRLAVAGGAGGALGGALAAIVYPFAVGYLLPNMQIDRVMPNDMMSTLIWLGFASAIIGVVLGGLGGRSSARNVPDRA